MTPFDDLDSYLALPRVAGLAVTPGGDRVVTTVSELDADGTEYVTAIWELDPAGVRSARRLTRGAKGESGPVFTADGDLLFLAGRAKPGEDSPPTALWRLPKDGGEAVEEFAPAGGVSAVHTAGRAARIVATAPLLRSAAGLDDDKRLRTQRKDNKVSAILHRGYPVRHWDHDLGPDLPHLFDIDGKQNLTPDPGAALRETALDVSADGTFVVTSWHAPVAGVALRSRIVRIDMATGRRTVIADDPGADLDGPVIAPDGRRIAFVRETTSTPTQAPRTTLCWADIGGTSSPDATGRGWTELTEWDRWPASVTWSADGTRLIVTADDNGRHPVFAVDPATRAVTRLTDDDHAYTDVCAAPGGVIFALRSSYLAPPHPVRIDPDGTVTVLPCVELPPVPGTVAELTAATPDGAAVRSWLVLPNGTEPAPLLLWVHGGPLGSWNTWHWRWNPWLLAAQGYAVLLPDPALSTGYGQDFIQRGWGAWGGPPYTDLMAATDAACAHPRIDPERTAAMGGSFGGYMANWIAGHTDRFAAIVTHASLWALDQFGPTTDGAYWWEREMTEQMTQQNSPHRHVEQIRTPMLVIHGDKDYRVPIGEGLRLWYELLSRSGLPADEDGASPHQFLYFPSEGHWVAAPQHTKIWYQVISAFLGNHLFGREVFVPELLG
ncbi:S9 family peptidase [Mycolicibacterium bacteremicum]|uniref:S9 family peptidase n=1 Tax=Mycolicibacterium bacteremicum TaxID=564198 RepID=A0A1W9Z281_MYCBA|nr:S9 family peptidase [Mycolicibacterium bacteremicum]MCV7433299.1 S9 family peptidase [Mycolicibacterium bacteremicum]ORA06431.1 S9 family peptidase [Mycolicibacterium bacteremicum]